MFSDDITAAANIEDLHQEECSKETSDDLTSPKLVEVDQNISQDDTSVKEVNNVNQRSFNADHCVICELDFEGDKAVHVSKKGISTIIHYCELNSNDRLSSYLNQCISTSPISKVLVHADCRRDFTNRRRVHNISPPPTPPSPKKLRSQLTPINIKEDCFICGETAFFDARHPNRRKVHTVTTLPISQNILKRCEERSDVWSSEINKRLHGCIDLVAAEAIYHGDCMVRFLSNKESIRSDKKTQGRPENQEMYKWFTRLYQWLDSESDSELYSLSDLHNKMIEFAGDPSIVYSIKSLKQKLLEHYRECIFIATVDGRSNVVCFRNMANYIINDKWYADKSDNILDEAERLITAAAKIIKAQIREKQYDSQTYPTNEDIANVDGGWQWVPGYLQLLLQTIINSDVKRTSIGHAIIQAARPRSVMSPILFGLGVEMDHVFGSRWLVNELSHLGFSITYDEVTKYKQSVIDSETMEALLSEYFPGTFTQWVADNVDHNVATLDGQGTLHGMGIMAISTPKDQPLISRTRIIYRRQRVGVSELTKNKGVTIVQYIGPAEKGLASLIYKPLIELQFPYTLPNELYSDLLYHSGWLFRDAVRPRPNWSGFMQTVFSGNQITMKSECLLLPIIDLNPGDDTCVYSTLLYVQMQADRLNIPTTCITFDQPLWLKAVEIIKAKSLNIVCRLGGFHTLMSFMGSIGSMMTGSGLEEALETVYGPNAVSHIISGKAFSRALRGNLLVESALVNKLLLAILPESTEENESGTSNTIETSLQIEKIDEADLQTVQNLFDSVENTSSAVTHASESEALMNLESCLHQYKSILAEKSPTAMLWLQYIEYVEVMKMFIRAERTGCWTLHLYAIGKMINLFAATGHINYAKSARLYLQMMLDLPTTHPWLYNSFHEHGFHTVRRSDRFWAGIWTDMAIEQIMMRAIKSRGGLTRGSGVTESVRIQWIYSMHKTSAVHDAMTTLTTLKHTTSEQHVEMGKSRVKRDFQDLSNIQTWFNEHEPFDPNEQNLRSISSGLIANVDGDVVNCHKTEEVGESIQRKLDNKNVATASMKTSERVRSLDQLQPGIQVDKQKVIINPNILFSRLIAIAQREEHLAQYFEYELTAIPTSLFKDNAMRTSPKAQLAKALTANVERPEGTFRRFNVLDGGSLLHRINWPKKATYKELVDIHVKYVRVKYGNCCIVFDGYGQGPSTKDPEHMKRSGKKCADINLKETMNATTNQQMFLSNEKNKSQFIALLSRYLEADGQVIHQSPGDADTLIVSRSCQYALEGISVNVVADDTDILVLLIYHWQPNMAEIYFRSEANQSITNVHDIVNNVGTIVSSHILFIHAWSGCDTTSATFGHGKTTLMKKMKNSEKLQHLSRVISDPDATLDQVSKAGIHCFIELYGGNDKVDLKQIRYQKFMEMVSSKLHLNPEKLPPTERSAHYHSLRVHHQLITWKDDARYTLDPKDWGWDCIAGKLQPIMTDAEAAPGNLLKYIRCNCKISSRQPCRSNLCSCRKNGLKCVAACGNCSGSGCQNSEAQILDEVDNLELGDM